MTDAVKPVWAGFWRRVGAFIVDSIVLGVCGFAVGTPMFDQLAAMEGPTRLIGLAVGVAYFGLLSSGLFGSATLGMRLLGLRVVSMSGRPLDPIRSIWRALLLQTPFVLNGLFVNSGNDLLTEIYGVLAITLVFGVNLAQLILLLFNLPSRRLVHDLLSGAAVVRKEAVAPLPRTRSPVPAVAFVVIGLFLAASVALTVLPIKDLIPGFNTTFEPLTKVQQSVLTLGEVSEVGVQDNTTTFYSSDGGAQTSHTLIVTARVRAWPKDPDAEVRRVGDAALKATKLQPGQGLRVVLRYGYDIGIASAWRTYTGDYSPPPSTDGASPTPTKPDSKSGPAGVNAGGLADVARGVIRRVLGR